MVANRQQVHVKNTFIDIDTRDLDSDVECDPRKVHSAPVVSLSLSSVSTRCDSADLTENELESSGIANVDLMQWFAKMSSAKFTQSFREALRLKKASGASSVRVAALAGLEAQVVPVSSSESARSHKYSISTDASTASTASTDVARVQPFSGGPSSTKTKASSGKEQSTPPVATTHFGEACSSWTCRMLRNLPNDYTRKDLTNLLSAHCIDYNFVYLPIDWGKRANLGYAFVNLTSNDEAERIGRVLDGFSEWKVASEKVCCVVWAKAEQQGLSQIIEHFRNSPVMHPDVPSQFRPLLFNDGGQCIAFPAPTKHIKPPREFLRNSGDRSRISKKRFGATANEGVLEADNTLVDT